jgi:hypothetical protein
VKSWGPHVRGCLAERRELFQVLRDAKWMLLLSACIGALLWLPGQVQELYRVRVDDLSLALQSCQTKQVQELYRVRVDDLSLALQYCQTKQVLILIFASAVPLCGIAMTVWLGTYQVTTETARAFSSISSRVRLRQALFL